MEPNEAPKTATGKRDGGSLRLQPEQIEMIEEGLSRVGEYGEVRLVVEKGQIRFITVSRSYDALKWRGGSRE